MNDGRNDGDYLFESGAFPPVTAAMTAEVPSEGRVERKRYGPDEVTMTFHVASMDSSVACGHCQAGCPPDRLVEVKAEPL